MEEFGALFSFVSLAGVLVIAVILLGPSLCSSYENWKIRQGHKGENPMSKIKEIRETIARIRANEEDKAILLARALRREPEALFVIAAKRKAQIEASKIPPQETA